MSSKKRIRPKQTREQKDARNLKLKLEREATNKEEDVRAVRAGQQQHRRDKEKLEGMEPPARRNTPQKYKVQPDMTNQGKGTKVLPELLRFGALSKAILVITDYSRMTNPTVAQVAMYERALLTLEHSEQAYQKHGAAIIEHDREQGKIDLHLARVDDLL